MRMEAALLVGCDPPEADAKLLSWAGLVGSGLVAPSARERPGGVTS